MSAKILDKSQAEIYAALAVIDTHIMMLEGKDANNFYLGNLNSINGLMSQLPPRLKFCKKMNRRKELFDEKETLFKKLNNKQIKKEG